VSCARWSHAAVDSPAGDEKKPQQHDSGAPEVLAVADDVGVPLPVAVLVPVPLCVLLDVRLALAVLDADGVWGGVPDRLADCVAVRDIDAVCEAVMLPVEVPDCVLVAVAVSDEEPELVAETEALAETEELEDAVFESVSGDVEAVLVEVSVPLPDAVILPDCVPLALQLGVTELLGVREGRAVLDADGTAPDDRVADGEAEPLREGRALGMLHCHTTPSCLASRVFQGQGSSGCSSTVHGHALFWPEPRHTVCAMPR